MALEAGLVADEREAASVDRVEQGVDLRGVDGGAAGALVARGLSEVADEGDLGGGGKRKQGRETLGGRVVLQQDAALRRGLAREGVVGVDVEGRDGVLDRLARGEHELDGLVGALVDVRLGDAPLADGRHELADGREAGGWHLEGGAGDHARGVVVRAAPVGDDGAIEAPLVAQDLAEQVLVLVGVDAVDEVIGAHDALGRGLAGHDLEAGEVDLAQRALVDDGVGRLAAGLLGVHGEVLGAGADSLGLDAAHVGGGHLAREVGVLGEVLEVAAAQRVALDA